ncbi:MAG: hypothetical protein M1819_002296 [Sarea resinae]|nr:MAG: hypothetical protein M1819_002296 [Sarea resinae]
MAPSTKLGNLLHLEPLYLSELPNHPSFETLPASATTPKPVRPDVTTFLISALNEASAFLNDTPQSFKRTKVKHSPPSTGKVHLFSREVRAAELAQIPWEDSHVRRHRPHDLNNAESTKAAAGESWFARVSNHANRGEPGTADWEEFENGLLVDHSKHEMMYTPDVYDAFKVIEWDVPEDEEAIGEEPGEGSALSNAGYAQVSMNIYEMCHSLPTPLTNRIFTNLVISARRTTTPPSFLSLQIPVRLPRSFTPAFYSSLRNLTEGSTAQKRKKTITGIYTAVESVRLLPESSSNQNGGGRGDGVDPNGWSGEPNIEWVMATASDARGWLPMGLQKMGVPGAVAKDVGLFMRWVEHRRNSKEPMENGGGGSP